MTEKIIIAGAGGQGIMLLGKILAETVTRENKQVTWLPAYGPEVRGGTAYCMVIISDEEIGSPRIAQADTLIIMNQLSLERFKDRINNKGLIILNSSLSQTRPVKNAKLLSYPFTDIAIKLGNIRIANMVALGCYVSQRPNINPADIVKAMEAMAPQEKQSLVEINKQALCAGMELVE